LFFQAEDGIRDRNVTGVQTCALPILASIISKVCPFLTVSPTETKTGLSGAGAKYATPTRGLVTSSPSTRGVSSVSLTASASDEDGEETTGATGTALTGGTATG